MIYVLLADGFEEIEALCPVDILRRGGCPVTTVAMGNNPVRGAHGISVLADTTVSVALDAPEKISLLLLPGGMPGAANLDKAPETDVWIARTLADGGRIGAICAAPLVLGHRGLLQGRCAVCYPGFETELTGATVLHDCAVISDGPITTAVGMGAAPAFGLELLSYLIPAQEVEQLRQGAFLPQSGPLPKRE